MDAPNCYLVILAGGQGTRFWPKSTARCPKQFLKFGNSPSLLAQTLLRFQATIPPEQTLVVTTESLQEPLQRLQTELNHPFHALLEPEGRNTAASIYWASQWVAERDPHAVLIITPADHCITQPEAFLKQIQIAIQWAAHHDDLITLGISPTRPETGFGYLQLTTQKDFNSIQRIAAFIEKPTLEKAQTFLESPYYLWNSGLFLWRAETILKAFDHWIPAMRMIWQQTQGNIQEAYAQFPHISIDYGILEKATNVVTLPIDCGWNDLGSWTSFETTEDNTLLSGDSVSINAHGNIIDAPHHFVALLGVSDLICVEHNHTLLIAHKTQAQSIRDLVTLLKEKHPDRL